jgi:hypothetical protein
MIAGLVAVSGDIIAPRAETESSMTLIPAGSIADIKAYYK